MSDQSTYPPPARLPTSDALNEAEPSSLQDLFSRNPEYMQDKNIDDIVLHMRDLRLRLEATATAPRHARVKAPAAEGSEPKVPRSRKVTLDFDDDFFNES